MRWLLDLPDRLDAFFDRQMRVAIQRQKEADRQLSESWAELRRVWREFLWLIGF